MTAGCFGKRRERLVNNLSFTGFCVLFVFGSVGLESNRVEVDRSLWPGATSILAPKLLSLGWRPNNAIFDVSEIC